jgi:hypothetical protein
MIPLRGVLAGYPNGCRVEASRPTHDARTASNLSPSDKRRSIGLTEAAELLGIAARTLRRHAIEGVIPGASAGSAIGTETKQPLRSKVGMRRMILAVVAVFGLKVDRLRAPSAMLWS